MEPVNYNWRASFFLVLKEFLTLEDEYYNRENDKENSSIRFWQSRPSG